MTPAAIQHLNDLRPERGGPAYLGVYPGIGGWLLFWACSGSVMLAGAKILDALRYERDRQPQP